jgi:hypothetical protein
VIPAGVHGDVDVHNVTVLKGPTMEDKSRSGVHSRKEVNSLVWDPVTNDIVDARTA